MGGQWFYRADPAGNGLGQGFAASASTAGWTPVTVPNAWNGKDLSEASFGGGVGWYRKQFHLPSAAKALSWIVRFESVNYRARLYLNGRRIGKNTGAYLPFEIRLPAGLLKRGGTNLLAIRVGKLGPEPGGLALWTIPRFAALDAAAKAKLMAFLRSL